MLKYQSKNTKGWVCVTLTASNFSWEKKIACINCPHHSEWVSLTPEVSSQASSVCSGINTAGALTGALSSRNDKQRTSAFFFLSFHSEWLKHLTAQAQTGSWTHRWPVCVFVIFKIFFFYLSASPEKKERKMKLECRLTSWVFFTSLFICEPWKPIKGTTTRADHWGTASHHNRHNRGLSAGFVVPDTLLLFRYLNWCKGKKKKGSRFHCSDSHSTQCQPGHIPVEQKEGRKKRKKESTWCWKSSC